MEDLRLKLKRKDKMYKKMFRRTIRNYADASITSGGQNNYQRTVRFIDDSENNYASPAQNHNIQKTVKFIDTGKPKNEYAFQSSNTQKQRNVGYISKNEAENADNNDPRWEELRKLNHIEEFKKYANSVFDFQSSNPNICQTHHGYKRKQLHIKSIRRKRFEKNASLKNHVNSAKDTCKGIKRKALEYPENQPPLTKRPKLEFESYVMEIRKAMSNHKLPKTNNSYANYYWHGSYWNSKSGLVQGEELTKRNWRFTLRHFNKAVEETKSIYLSMCCDEIHAMKDGLNLFMSHEELKKITDLEKLYGQFVRFYGPNEEIKCKWCKAIEGQDVWHPY